MCAKFQGQKTYPKEDIQNLPTSITGWLQERQNDFCLTLHSTHDFLGSNLKLEKQFLENIKKCPMYIPLRRRYPRKKKHTKIF